MQITKSPQVFDVVVVGSGAGGGTAVKVLTDKGLQVALLEAGPMLHPEKDFREHVWPYQVDHRGAGAHSELYFGRQQWGYFAAPDGLLGHSRRAVHRRPRPGMALVPLAHRGRTHQSLRPHLPALLRLRFQARQTASSEPWPVTYEEMSPWYDKAEGFIGVTGTKEGLRTAPDGNFLPSIPPRVHEVLIQKSCGKLNIPCIPSRMAMLTKSINGRAACHYCGQCGRGCITASAFSSSQAMIFPAMKTGKLTLITGAMARELITDSAGKVTAVSYVDKATRTEKQIRCRAVVVAASACESARLLLNSKSTRFPAGIANSSGQVGRNLTDSVGYSLSGTVPALLNLPRHNSDGIGGMHVYVPWWLLGDKKKDFPRGYHIEIGGGFGMPMIGSFHGECARHRRLRQEAQGFHPRTVRRHRRLRRTRRNDPQRGHLVRDRSAARGRLGHSRPPLPLPLERRRNQPGAPHARNLHRHHRNHGRPRPGRSGPIPKPPASPPPAPSFTKPAP